MPFWDGTGAFHYVITLRRSLHVGQTCLLAGISLLTGCTRGEPVNESALKVEIAKQAAEVPECERRLATIYRAWVAYTREHKGAEPGSVESLIPRYISDPAAFTCPTAKRWIDSKHNIGHGEITINGKKVLTSYGFLWLTSGAVRAKRLLGDKAPVALCQSHTEALYMAAYNKMLRPGTMVGEKRLGLAPDIRNSKDIAVLRNGKTEHVDPESQ